MSFKIGDVCITKEENGTFQPIGTLVIIMDSTNAFNHWDDPLYKEHTARWGPIYVQKAGYNAINDRYHFYEHMLDKATDLEQLLYSK